MKKKLHLAFVVAALTGFALSGYAQEPSGSVGVVNAPEFKNLSDLKWNKILPDLGADSPKITILHVDPKTHATSLLIRTPKAIHVRKHWHTANESHTMIIGICHAGMRRQKGRDRFRRVQLHAGENGA
jgi:hypothetical protein